MTDAERDNLIKEQTIAMWRCFNRRLDPDSSGTDQIVIQDYTTALERVPNRKLLDVFRKAKALEKLPRAAQMFNLYRPADTEARSGEKTEIFRPDFREYLNGTASAATELFLKTGNKSYRIVSELCDQADMLSHGAVQRLTMLNSTKECIGLMKDWAFAAKVPREIIGEVM